MKTPVQVLEDRRKEVAARLEKAEARVMELRSELGEINFTIEAVKVARREE